MRRLIIAFFIGLPVLLAGQFEIQLSPVDFPEVPPVQSYAWGQYDGKWLIAGGRIDGLHRRQPFAAFLPSGNNDRLWVIDPIAQQVWSASVAALPAPVREQLQSTNMAFHQRGDTLYLVGGYAYSPTTGDHVTFPRLTTLALPEVIGAIVAGEDAAPFVQSTADERMAVSGGQLAWLDDRFYLVGGHRFDGRYNPHGPDHGPGFSQEYTDEVRRFRVTAAGDIIDYEVWHDALHLHRRDYNLAPQIMPDGAAGLTIFSGVFQHGVDLPFTNTVDIRPEGYAVNEEFTQYLCHYHTAHLPVYSEEQQAMHTVFFGGISQFYFDGEELVEDAEAPFVRTISRVTRAADGAMSEARLPLEMPGYLGAGAEFIPAAGAPFNDDDILLLDELSADSARLIGYVYGGIESSERNVFFQNGDDLSWASNTLFAVYLRPAGVSEVKEPAANTGNPLTLEVYPNPVVEKLTVRFRASAGGSFFFLVMNAQGRIVDEMTAEAPEAGQYDADLEVAHLPDGIYFLNLSDGKHLRTVRFAKEVK